MLVLGLILYTLASIGMACDTMIEDFDHPRKRTRAVIFGVFWFPLMAINIVRVLAPRR